MARYGPLAALTLLLAACAGGPQTRREPDRGEVTVSWELDVPTVRPREGDLATLVLRIRNGGAHPILLRDLTFLADPASGEIASAAASWQSAQKGTLTLVPERNEWLYQKGGKGETPPVFSSGLLIPKETLTIRSRLRLLRFPKNFQLFYFEITPEELRRNVYFEVRQGREYRYQLLLGRDLENRLIPSQDPEADHHRVVVFPHIESLSPKGRLKTFQVHADLQPRPFPLDQALARARVSKPDVWTFSTSLDGWIFGTRDGDYRLVTPERIVPLPAIRNLERVFHHVDAVGVGKHQVELLRESIAVAFQELRYRVVPQADEKRTRYFLFLSAQDLPRLFEDARTLKRVIDVDVSADGGRLLVAHE